MNNTCVMCGTIIPEGRQVCPICQVNPMRFAPDPQTPLEEPKGLAPSKPEAVQQRDNIPLNSTT